MFKKISEQESMLGITEWWSLKYNYEVVIRIDSSFLIIDNKSNVSTEDETKKLFDLLINRQGVNVHDYKLEKFPLGGHGIYFPSEKKMYTLELINEILEQNPNI